MSPNKIEWTDELVKNFWDQLSSDPNKDKKYFTNQNGKGIIEFLKTSLQLSGKKVCDYGCGKGFLIEHLLNSNSQVWGLDFSQESVDYVNHRFNGKQGWNGALKGDGNQSGFENDFFDIIVCVETIEHVLDIYLEPLFNELKRILKPGGVVFFSTPNNEELEKNMVYCPNCNSVFHRMQHVRSWTVNSLTKYASSVGLKTIFAAGISLKTFQTSPVQVSSILDISIRKVFQIVELYFYRLLGRRALLKFFQRKFNTKANLVALVTKE